MLQWSSWNFLFSNLRIYYRNWSTFCRPVPFSSFLHTNCFYSSRISLPSFSLHWTSCLSHETPTLCCRCLLPFNPRFVLILVYGNTDFGLSSLSLTHTHIQKTFSCTGRLGQQSEGSSLLVFSLEFNLRKRVVPYCNHSSLVHISFKVWMLAWNWV